MGGGLVRLADYGGWISEVGGLLGLEVSLYLFCYLTIHCSCTPILPT